MPLIICAVCFAALFLFEAAWYWAGIAEQERALRCYERVEHPLRLTSDHYLDVLG